MMNDLLPDSTARSTTVITLATVNTGGVKANNQSRVCG